MKEVLDSKDIEILLTLQAYPLATASFIANEIDMTEGSVFLPFFQLKDLLANFLIVLAFSFYIELMKSAVTEKTWMEAEIRVAQRIQNELIPEILLNTEVYELFGKTITRS